MAKAKFRKPDVEEDQELLKKEDSRGQRTDYSERFWKPEPGENLIRVLPARGETNASYHMIAGKHFIKHKDRIESFVCPKETFGEECPACEKFLELVKKGKKQEANRYRVKRIGVFNVIDRTEEEPVVKLYEAPRKAVWHRVVKIVTSKRKQSHILDEINSKFEVTKPGRDIFIDFDPDADPQSMYTVYPTDAEELGTPEEIQKWYEEIVDLLPENVYTLISYEDAEIKMDGTKEEREELRERWAREREEDEEEEDEEEVEEDDDEEEEEKPKKKKLKKKVKRKQKEEDEEEEVEEEEDSEEEDSEEEEEDLSAKVRKRVSEYKKKKKKSKK